jgi:hypothetical protein
MLFANVWQNEARFAEHWQNGPGVQALPRDGVPNELAFGGMPTEEVQTTCLRHLPDIGKTVSRHQPAALPFQKCEITEFACISAPLAP